MRAYTLVILFSVFTFLTRSQTIFWQESFGVGCSQGQVAAGTVATPTNGAWAVTSTGTNDASANEWFISATEAGMGAGNCGNGCLNSAGLTNRTLHVGSVAIPSLGLSTDQGAAYNAGGMCPAMFCVTTNKRAESPIINCTGYNNITLNFVYMMNGQAGTDFCNLLYFDGAVWNTVVAMPQSAAGACAPQGMWSSYSVVLPASANNNPNVKIGFNWTNNDDGIGTDPSFAVDDIQLSVTSSLSATVTVSTPTMCVGNTATVTANTGTATVTGYTWSSNPSGATFGTPNASLSTVSFGAAGVYSINILVTNGTNTATATQTIGVAPSPTITITASSSNTICPSGNATLTASGGATSFTWSPAGSLSSPSGASVVASPTINTTYTVVGTNAFGCPASSTINVIIGPPLSLNVTPSSATTCIGASGINITAIGATIFNWAPSTGLSTSSGPMVVATPSSSTTYTVIGSTGSCTALATCSITVTPPPNFTVTPTNTVVCKGSSQSYTASGVNSYTWSPAFTLSSNTGSVVAASPTINTTYTVIGKDASGCLANAQVITLTVLPVPTATAFLTTPGGGYTVCHNSTATLAVNTSTPPMGYSYSYTWTPATNVIGSPFFQTVTLSGFTAPADSTIFTYTAVVAYATLSTCISAPTTVSVVVKNCNPPVASFTTVAPNDTICTGQCVTFMNTSTGGKPQIVKWNFPGAQPDTASGTFPTVCYNVPGSYTVSIIVKNPYGKDSIIHNNYIHVVDTPSTKGIRDTTILFGNCVTLYGTQANYYNWTSTGFSCTGCDTIHPCLTETTMFFVTGYNSKHCKYTDTVIVTVDKDCGEMFIPNAFSPNGDNFNDVLYVRGKCLVNFTFQVFNRWGEKVFETSDQKIGWDGTQNGQQLNTGVFVYKLEGTTYDGKSFIQKGNITLLR